MDDQPFDGTYCSLVSANSRMDRAIPVAEKTQRESQARRGNLSPQLLIGIERYLAGPAGDRPYGTFAGLSAADQRTDTTQNDRKILSRMARKRRLALTP